MITRIQSLYRRQPLAASGNAARYGLFLLVFLTILTIIWIFYRTVADPIWLAWLPIIAREFLDLLQGASVATLVFIWLILLWRSYRKQPQTAVSILTVDELYALSPGDFEAYVGQLFRQKGYRVKLRGRSGDLGVDVELHKRDGKKAVVQCKRYRTTVGSEIVRELYGTLIHERAAHAFLVTTADISDAAREWAQYKPITLIDGETLVQIATSLQNQPK
ncbi:MAG: restriction endonuclease [Chloroflexota bacterium]